ncbi:MAG: hypothetical protein IT445_19480 [Phycisphaeraceae bacterium]|nr:hypothetical protein [Phycisphaeraceae bacterium]
MALAVILAVITAGAMTNVFINAANAYGLEPTDQGWLQQWDARLEPVRQGLSPDRIYGFAIPNLDQIGVDYAYFRGVDEYLLAPIVISDRCQGPLVLIDAITEDNLQAYLDANGQIIIEQRFGNGLALQRRATEREP